MEGDSMKKMAIVLAATLVLLYPADIFEQKCIPCHRNLPTSLGEMFKNYLLIYSSERFVKAGIKHYLRNPSRSISVMSELFIDTYGIKQPTTLSDKELNEAVDIYWERFKVFDKLK